MRADNTMTLRLCWVALSTLFLGVATSLEDPPDSPGLPFVFHYQGAGAAGWVCCAGAPSAACLKSQGTRDCPACGPCLPPVASQDKSIDTTPRYSNSHNYFRGKPTCKGVCHMDGSGHKLSAALGESSEGSGGEAVPLQNKGRPGPPLQPPRQNPWPGPQLPPRNQPPPRPPPVPPRPNRPGRK